MTIEPPKSKSLSYMDELSAVNPAEVIAEYIPSQIHVVSEIPKEEAKLGLHYVMPLQNAGVQATTYDMRRLLHYMYERDSFITSMRSIGIFDFLWPRANVMSLTPVQVDDAYTFGYNSLRYIPGHGTTLWSNQIATVDIELNDVVGFHKLLMKLADVTVRLSVDESKPWGKVVYENGSTWTPKERFHYLSSGLDRSMHELIVTQQIFRGEVAYYHNQSKTVFQLERALRPPVIFEMTLEGAYVILKAVDNAASTMLRVLRAVNPDRFKGPAIGVDDPRFVFYRPEKMNPYPIILLDESVYVTSK